MAAAVCPPSAVIEAFAAGTCTDQTVSSHLECCAACRAAVDEACRNQLFMAEVRTVLAAPGAAGPRAGGGHGAAGSSLLAGYQLQEEIYRGGQGVVYRAVQTRTGRTVAIKLLPGGPFPAGRQKERFEREVRMAAGLRHPNIVTVHDSAYTPDGRCALVMEYIEGVHLDHWSRSLDGARGREARRRALRQRLGVMIKVCDAVLYAHQHSIVHRDLKPGNILVDAAGEPHILDFGIARDLGPEQRTRLTHTGEFAGTLAYASPEQVSGDPACMDTRTDIYSLGVIMYELVSGRMPYPVDGPMSRTLRSIESAEPAPLPRRTRDPDDPWVDGEVATIILKAMAKEPARRYQTAAGVRNDLGRYLAGEAIEARRDSTWYILRKTAARHRVIVGAAALIFILLAAFGVAMARQARRLEVRGRELAAALSESNIERGRSLAVVGHYQPAEDAVWPELIRAGVTRIDGPEVGFTGSPEVLHPYWALWEIFQRSRCAAVLETHDTGVVLVYFDKGGKRFSAIDGKAHLVSWSVATWERLRDVPLVPPPHRTDFCRAARSPGGDIAIFDGGLVYIIDPETGTTRAKADDPDHYALDGAFSADGALLATIGRDNCLRVWDARSLAITMTTADGLERRVATAFCAPAFSPDGRLVAAALPNGAIGLWNSASGALERTLPPPASLTQYIRGGPLFKSIAFGLDGTIVAGLGTHLVRWPADGRAAEDLGAPAGLIFSVAFLSGSHGRRIASTGTGAGGGGGVTFIWDLVTGARPWGVGQSRGSTACALSPDDRLIAVGNHAGTVRLYEIDPDPHVSVLQAGAGSPSVAALSPDGRVVAMTAAPDGPTGRDVVLMNLRSRATIGRFHREGRVNNALEFAPDGGSLFGGDWSGKIMQWDVSSGSLVREFSTPDTSGLGAGGRRPEPRRARFATGGTNQIRLSPDGSILARARDDGLIGLWDVPTGLWIDWLDSGTTELAVIDFSPDGTALVAHHPEAIVVWDVHTRKMRRMIAGDAVFPAVRFARRGAVIAASRFSGGSIQFLDTHTGRVLAENGAPSTAGMGMAFHPGGAVLAASAFDSSIRLWDTRTGRELLALHKHTALIRSLLFTPDGNTLISSDDSGMVLAWDLAYYNDRIRREMEHRAAHPNS